MYWSQHHSSLPARLRSFPMSYNNFNTLVASVATPPAPPPPSGSACANAHGVIGSFLCGSSTTDGWLSALSFMLWRWLQAWSPLLIVAAVMALTAGAVLALVVRRARREARERARGGGVGAAAARPRRGAAGLCPARARVWH